MTLPWPAPIPLERPRAKVHPTGGRCDANPNQKPRPHDTSRIAWAKLLARVGEEFPPTDRRAARDRSPQPLTGVGREAPKPREQPTGTRSTPTREKRRRWGIRSVLANRLRQAETPNLAAQGQSISRKTAAKVPLTGLSLKRCGPLVDRERLGRIVAVGESRHQFAVWREIPPKSARVASTAAGIDISHGIAVPLEGHRLSAFFNSPHDRGEVCFCLMDVDVDHSGELSQPRGGGQERDGPTRAISLAALSGLAAKR